MSIFLKKSRLKSEEEIQIPDKDAFCEDVDLKANQEDVFLDKNYKFCENVHLDPDVGEFTCPSCWQKFDYQNVMSIAVSDDLMGDTLLGEFEKLRFLPTKFNINYIPLDPTGLACTDFACPHCRRKLPTGFLESNHHILSIVGAPSSGKTYYLSVLIKMLQSVLYRNFKITLMDADPSGNVLLNSMKNKLFSASGIDQTYLTKTQLEGTMYDKLIRKGKQVALPKPFVYSISKENSCEEKNPIKKCDLIFYDNAGEHFEPDKDIDSSPGALHVAFSSAIFYLYDPSSNSSFKTKLLEISKDPQLDKSIIDQQDIILAEMNVRIKKIKGISYNEKIDTPLCVIVGKSDIYEKLIEPLKNPFEKKGEINYDAIDYNSDKLKNLLLEQAPEIVANSQALSKTVKFFPVSSFGHSPEIIKEGVNKGRLAPCADKINPKLVEVPVIWALSILEKDLFSEK